jgi:hypothetical protein
MWAIRRVVSSALVLETHYITLVTIDGWCYESCPVGRQPGSDPHGKCSVGVLPCSYRYCLGY